MLKHFQLQYGSVASTICLKKLFFVLVHRRRVPLPVENHEWTTQGVCEKRPATARGERRWAGPMELSEGKERPLSVAGART